jgi:hypothetical protein
MSTAIVDVDGNVRQLDARADAPVAVTADEVKDPEKLARLLNDMRRDLANERRRWKPRETIFKDHAATAGTAMRLDHGFGGGVLYTIKSWTADTPGDPATFEISDDSDDSTLVLTPASTGTVTVLVEEAG